MRCFSRILKWFSFWLFSFITLGTAGAIFFYWNIKEDLPQLPPSLNQVNFKLPLEIYSSDGILIKVLGLKKYGSLEEISPHLINAILATEDSSFFNHHGIDHISILRSFFINLKNDRIVQGGSTITQQLSKNLFFSFEKNLIRKIKEILMAVQMEVMYSKNEILEAYCNQIYFGYGRYGVEEASQFYFGKTSRKLGIKESALLAGIPRWPEKGNPFRNLKLALTRSRYILGLMEKNGFITMEQRIKAVEGKINLRKRKADDTPNQYFIDFVLKELEKKYEREFVYFGGIRVYTTLDTKFQKAAYKSAGSHLKFLESRMKNKKENRLQTAIVSIENKNGAIRTMLGGRNYRESQFNRALSNERSPGSAFKPIIYMSAMENLGFHPATVIVDEPVSIPIKGFGIWSPKNYNEKYFGQVTLKMALAKSLNTISTKIVFILKPEKVIETARKFGIRSPLGKNLSLALGTSGVSPLEMASAYSVVANQGKYVKPFAIRKIDNFHGKTLYEHYPNHEQVFSEISIYPLLDMMRGVIENGSGRVVRKIGFKDPAGGKTGTTNNSKDGWFVGFNQEYSTSVWVGFDNNEPMTGPGKKGLNGSQVAAPIWALYYKKIMKDRNSTDFSIPEGIHLIKVNGYSGIKEEKITTGTLVVALDKNITLKNTMKEEIVKIKKESKEIAKAGEKDNFSYEKKVTPVLSKADLTRKELSSKIWFMVNLETASLGAVDKLDSNFLLGLLKVTKHLKGSEYENLKKGRANVLSVILTRLNKEKNIIMNRNKLRNSLTQDEVWKIKDPYLK